MKLNTLAILLTITASLGSCSQNGACEGSLSEIGAGCLATFDGTFEQLPACTEYMSQFVLACGEFTDLVLSGGYTGVSCFYDSTSHALVGAQWVSDIPEFCGNSYTKSAGRVAGRSCSTSTPVIERFCPGQDAGTTSQDAGTN